MEINVDIMRKKIYAYKNEKTNAAFDLPYRVYYPSDYSAENGTISWVLLHRKLWNCAGS